MVLDSCSSLVWIAILCIVNVNVNYVYVVKAVWIEFDFVKIENSNKGLVKTNLNVVRKDRTTFAISGTMELTKDLSDEYDLEASIYYSPLGNNQYTLSPYKYPRGPLCAVIDGRFRTYIQSGLEEVSDCPKEIKNKPLCPLYKKGNYTVRGYTFDKSSIPQLFHIGQYKMEFVTYKKGSDEINSKGGVIFKLY